MMNRRTGVTVMELLVVSSLVGIFLASFLPGFFRDLRTSKVDEASEQLEILQQKTADYFAEHHHETPWGAGKHCLPSYVGPTPEFPTQDMAEIDFFDSQVEGNQVWKAIGFNPKQSRFRYSVIPFLFGCDLGFSQGKSVIVFRAEGDLDGDGKFSLFEREAGISEDLQLVPHGFLRAINRTE